ncbi:MAG: 16S rRNA (guanine(966)-N(2))-methyltransferase RsmD [Lentisphaeria bacterium]
MRIISGQARGLKLKAPRGSEVRPTTDRVKETLFAILGDVSGQRVLDLFAGSGALGLEALSRGAEEVVLVEKKRQILQTLEFNLSRVRHCLPQDNDSEVRVLRADARKIPEILEARENGFDIIFADPPYVEAKNSYGARQLLIDPAFRHWAGTALLVLEHPSDLSIPPEAYENWRFLRQRRFDRTTISFARPV